MKTEDLDIYFSNITDNLSPLWTSWWAYLAYLVFIIIIIVFFLEIRKVKIKERKKGDARIKELEKELFDELNKIRMRLFTNLSNELHEPVRLIQKSLDEMSERLSFDTESNGLLNEMNHNYKRLSRLSNSLTDFLENESGRLKIDISEGDLVSFTKEISSSFLESAKKRNVHFNFNYKNEVKTTVFDHDLMGKVFYSIFSNALKNTSDNGEIKINLLLLDFPALKRFFINKIQTLPLLDLPYIVVEISDAGPGIPSEDIINFFDPLYQIIQGNRIISDLGLELNLSRAIIEKHHGVMWVESPNEKGVVFRIILPLGKSVFQGL